MEHLRILFQEKGYSLKSHQEDTKSLFCCLHSAIHSFQHPVSLKNANQMQKNIFDFEKKNAKFFHLFQPKCISCNGNHTAIDCLQHDLDQMTKEKKPPSPRECFAAADLLQRGICIVRCNQLLNCDIHRLQGYIFAPTDKKSNVLMLEKGNGVIEFANILTTDLSTYPVVFVNMDHKHCFGLRFTNEFSLLFDGRVSYGSRTDVKDLYRLWSLEFYGTEENNCRILNIICNFELEEDNLDLFCKFVDSSVNEKTSLDNKKKILRSHIQNVRNRLKLSAEGEFYALSSVYNVDIIIDKTGRGEWETFMPVVCTYASCFDSPIILQIQNGDYIPYVTTPNVCSCCQKIPEIQGHIGKIKGNLHETVLKTPCCPGSGRRHNHTHLQHLSNIRTFWPQLIDYLKPPDDIEMVQERLKTEDRRLDQINGGNGSLVKAIAKELYGDENKEHAWEVLGHEELDIDEKLLRLANRLSVPIYLYCGVEDVASVSDSQRCVWTKYEPDFKPLAKTSTCRFYITLFYNRTKRSFDRVTPLQGCNCQIPPPLSLLKNSCVTGNQYLESVIKIKRHHPLVTFLSDDPNENMFEKEIRDFPAVPPYSSLKVAKQRSDMEKRSIDCAEYSRHSLLRNLSKEIFGTEKHTDILIKELSNELLQNIAHYLPFIEEDIKEAYKTTVGKFMENQKCYEKLAILIRDRIEDDLPCGDLLLWLACSFLQTPVYVLRITDTRTSTESFWTEYAKIRTRKSDPAKKTSYTKQCLPNYTHYITLLDTGYGQYLRIVPKTEACNCALEIPEVPSYKEDKTLYYSEQDRTLLRHIRQIDSQLKLVCILIDQWLFCNQTLQQKCDAMIVAIEGRRKNVNIATITGTSAGIVGAALTGVGIALAPITAGISTILSVFGAVLAMSGGTVATGAKITESVLNKSTIDTLKRYQNCYRENVESLNSAMSQLKEDLKKLEELSTEIQVNQNLNSTDFAGVQSIPGMVRALKGLLMIPLSVLKASSRGILILGAIIGPISAIVDATLLVFSAYNMAKGNKTDVTEDLRRLSASLYASRRQMHSWAYGNQKQFTYN